MTSQFFEHGGEVAITIPREVAERYHLAPGVEVEIIPDEDGIVLQPIGVEPWFSMEWERALDAVVEHYGAALDHLSE